MMETEGSGEMTNTQLYLVIGAPILFNGLRFVFGFTMLFTKVNRLEGKLSKVEAKLGIA